MHRIVGGLAPAAPLYARVRIAPRPGGDLTWATTSLRTPHGEICVGWEVVDGNLNVVTDLPAGVEADLALPGAEQEIVTASKSVRRSAPLPATTRPASSDT